MSHFPSQQTFYSYLCHSAERKRDQLLLYIDGAAQHLQKIREQVDSFEAVTDQEVTFTYFNTLLSLIIAYEKENEGVSNAKILMDLEKKLLS